MTVAEHPCTPSAHIPVATMFGSPLPTKDNKQSNTTCTRDRIMVACKYAKRIIKQPFRFMKMFYNIYSPAGRTGFCCLFTR